jgi:hypothetical protein
MVETTITSFFVAVPPNGSVHESGVVVGNSSDVTTTVETRAQSQMLIMMQPPPATIDGPFDVVLSLQTTEGIPVRGEIVEALLFSPAGTGVRLEEGCSSVITDHNGVANFTLRLTRGDSTQAFLIFGSRGTYLHDGPAYYQAAITNSLLTLASSATESAGVALPFTTTIPAAAQGAQFNSLDAAAATPRTFPSRFARPRTASFIQTKETTALTDSDSDPFADLHQCISSSMDGGNECHGAFQQALAATVSDTTPAKPEGGGHAADVQETPSTTSGPRSNSLQSLIGRHPGLLRLESVGKLINGLPIAPTVQQRLSSSGFVSDVQGEATAMASSIDRAVRDAGFMSDDMLQARIQDVTASLASMANTLRDNQHSLLQIGVGQQLESCVNLVGFAHAVRAGATPAANNAFTVLIQAANNALKTSMKSESDAPADDPIVRGELVAHGAVSQHVEAAGTDAAELLAAMRPVTADQANQLLSFAMQHSPTHGPLRLNDIPPGSIPVAEILSRNSSQSNSSQSNSSQSFSSNSTSSSETSFHQATAAAQHMLSHASTFRDVTSSGGDGGRGPLRTLPAPMEALTAMLTEPQGAGLMVLEALSAAIDAQTPSVISKLASNLLGDEAVPTSEDSLRQQLADEMGHSNGTADESRAHGITSINALLASSGSTISGSLPMDSTLTVDSATSVSGIQAAANGMAVCFESAGAAFAQAELLVNALPSYQEILTQVMQLGAAFLASLIEQLGERMGDLVASIIVPLWPDFEHAWATHVGEIGQDLATVGKAFQNATGNRTGANVTLSPSNASASSLSWSHEQHVAAVTAAKHRLNRSARGRSLLATIDDTEGHAGAVDQWQASLRRQQRFMQFDRYDRADKTHTAEDKTHTAEAPQKSHVHRRAIKLTSMPTTSSSQVLSPLDMMPDAFSWQARMMMVGLLGVGGSLAPPTSMLQYNPHSDAASTGFTDSVVLTAPVIGYGTERIEDHSRTGWRVSVQEYADDDDISNNTDADNFRVIDSSAPAIRSCAAFGYLHYEESSPQPEVPMLFQPKTMSYFNWLLEAGVYPDGTSRTYCPALDAPPEERTVLSEDGAEERRYGRVGIKPIVFDRSGDVAAAMAVPAVGGSARARAARNFIADSCPTDPLSLMRTEIAPLCQESYIATAQTSPFTANEYQTVGLDPSRKLPQLIVRDANGNPIEGKTCIIEDLSDAPYWGMFDGTPFGMAYECGPSDVNGIINIRNLAFHGGSNRRLDLRITVDGVRAQPEPGSRWRFDTRVFYISADQPHMGHASTIIMGGHESIYLFILVSLLAMSTNAVSSQYNSNQSAPPTMKLIGMVALLGLTYTTSAFFARHFVHTDDVSRISMLSLRDMVATRADTLAYDAWFVALLAMLLSFIITLQVTFVWIRDQYDTLRRDFDRFGMRLIRYTIKCATRFDKCASCMSSLRGCSIRIHDCLKRPVDAFSRWLERGDTRVARGFNFIITVFSPVSETFDKGLEPPPYWEVLGVKFRSPFEARADRRMRAARNYVRKLLRGRKWLQEELERHQDKILKRHQNTFTLGISRLLGLATRVHPHLPYQLRDDFFYPERLYFGVVLSLWLQLMISIALIGCTRAAYGAIHGVSEAMLQLDAAAAAQMQPSTLRVMGFSDITPLGAIMLTMVANCYQIMGMGDSVEDVASLIDTSLIVLLQIAAGFLGIIAMLLHVVVWVKFFRKYRERIFQMRTGRYFFDARKFDETAGSSFIGYQAAFMIFSMNICLGVVFLFIVLFGSFIVMAIVAFSQTQVGIYVPPLSPVMITSNFTFNDTSNATSNAMSPASNAISPALNATSPASNAISPASNAISLASLADAYTVYADQVIQRMGKPKGIPTFFWWAVVGFLFQYVFNKYVWFAALSRTRDNEIRNRWLRFRFWYAIYEYVLIIPNIAIGMFMIIVRMIVALVMWIYFAFSIDICILPSASGIEHYDAGHASYVAAARTDHRYNNPIVMVFVSLLQEDLKQQRLEGARFKVRTHLRRRAQARKEGTLEALIKERAAIGDKEAKLLEEAEAGQGFFLDAGEALRKDDPEADDDLPTPKPSARKGNRQSLVTSKIESMDQDKMAKEVSEGLTKQKNKRRIYRKWQLTKMMVMNPSLDNMRAFKRVTKNLQEVDDMALLHKKGEELILSGSRTAYAGAMTIGEQTMPTLRTVTGRSTEVLGDAAGAISSSVGDLVQRSFSSKPVGSASQPESSYTQDGDGNWVRENIFGGPRAAWSQLRFPEMPEMPFFQRPAKTDPNAASSSDQ